MLYRDVSRLGAIEGFPALSILLPTHRTAPDNRQDPIRLKNMVKEATVRLRAGCDSQQSARLLAGLDELVADIDHRYNLDGLALFVNEAEAHAVALPFAVAERVVLGDRFAIRDLVRALNRSPRYRVMALSEQPTRLYEGVRDSLVAVQDGGFPLAYEAAGETAPTQGDFGIEWSTYQLERHRQFFHTVDEALGTLLTADPQPLLLVGVQRYLSLFAETSGHMAAVIGTLAGSHDKTTPHDLAQLAWPIVREALHQRRMALLDELSLAVGAHRSAAGMAEVWPLAHDGRGDTLLVEEGFHYPARPDPSGRVLAPADDPAALGVQDDAVDDLVATVLAKGGRAVFVDPGALEEHQRVAMLLRY